MRTLLIICLMMFIGSSVSAQEFEYIGAKKCKICHNKPAKGAQYKVWLNNKHAKAMESLKGAEKNDPKCIKCHSTVGHVDAKLVLTLTKEEGVSCESCHGPGSKYKPNSIMKSREKSMAKGLILPTEKVCKKCHNEESPHYKGFNYEEYVKMIAHDNPLTK
ncbi:MAG: cytochrome C554 [Bacteroidetes bacterium]|nr:cytochrome C554 [Bacteroidota bacterium]